MTSRPLASLLTQQTCLVLDGALGTDRTRVGREELEHRMPPVGSRLAPAIPPGFGNTTNVGRYQVRRKGRETMIGNGKGPAGAGPRSWARGDLNFHNRGFGWCWWVRDCACELGFRVSPC